MAPHQPYIIAGGTDYTGKQVDSSLSKNQAPIRQTTSDITIKLRE